MESAGERTAGSTHTCTRHSSVNQQDEFGTTPFDGSAAPKSKTVFGTTEFTAVHCG